jgi:hypothetical protein
MARFDRDLGLVRYDFEDGGFGMGGPSQEEFLSNIIRPPQPFVQATPQPAAPQPDPVAALFASQEPTAQPIAQPVTEPAPVYAPFNSSSGIIEDVEEPLERFVQDVTEPTPLAPAPTPQPTQPEQPAKPAGPAPEVLGSLTKQILGSSDTSKWSGAGYGSAEKNAEDMAKILAGIGITDIKQFGPITRQVQKIQGYEETGEPIYQTVTEQTYGNKETGQAVPNTYTERQTGNFFGGTYEGKGNTGYGVQFDAQGNPIFYTQGASSSDIGKIAPLLTLASFVPGLQPFAAGLNSLIAAKQGNVLGAIAGAAGLGNMAGISGMADVANAARFASAVKSGDPLAIAFSGANLGGVTNIGGVDLKDISKTIGAVKAIESGDPLTMMLYGMDAMSKSDGSSPTKSSADLQTEDPLSPEEQAQLIENRLNAAISRSQISPDEEDANTQRAIEDLERMYGPSSATRSFTPEPQVDEADDFLKSIGIKTIDRPSDSGLSNDDILNLINADDNRVLVNANRGITRPTETPIEAPPSYLPTDDDFMPTPITDAGELKVVDNRPKDEMTVQQEPANIDDFLKLLEPYKAPAEKLSELVVTGDRPMPSPDDDFMPTPIDDGGELEIVGNKQPTASTPAPTTPGVTPAPKAPAGPVKAPTTRAPASRSSNMDLLGLLALLSGQQAPAQQAPMQDPYAHIKLMEDLFGSTIDLTPAGENAARRK